MMWYEDLYSQKDHLTDYYSALLYVNAYSPNEQTTIILLKVEEAYLNQVNLSAQGFYATPDLFFDWSTGKGNLYNYFSYGASASEVEVDTLTGDFTILRSDLVMDVGDSLNPAIDIGQVRSQHAKHNIMQPLQMTFLWLNMK